MDSIQCISRVTASQLDSYRSRRKAQYLKERKDASIKRGMRRVLGNQDRSSKRLIPRFNDLRKNFFSYQNNKRRVRFTTLAPPQAKLKFDVDDYLPGVSKKLFPGLSKIDWNPKPQELPSLEKTLEEKIILQSIREQEKIPILTVDELIQVDRIPGLAKPYDSISEVIEDMNKTTLLHTSSNKIDNTVIRGRRQTFIKNKYQHYLNKIITYSSISEMTSRMKIIVRVAEINKYWIVKTANAIGVLIK